MSTPRRISLLTAITLLVLVLPMLLAQPALAEHRTLYVDAAATQNGDGSRHRPFWRITDAVVRARALRQEDGDEQEKRIVIHVRPGTYVGSYDRDHLAGNPRLELLPIILNVSDLSLEGRTELDEDSDGLPTGTYPHESETLLTTDRPLTGGQMLLLIATTTDGMAGNRVSVNGFVMDAQDLVPANTGFDIYADRVSAFSIHHTLLQHGGTAGGGTRLASGIFEANFLAPNIDVGVFINGGSMVHPASVTVRRNRSIGNVGGTTVTAVGSLVTLDLGTNPLMLEPLQMIYDRNNPEDVRNIPDTLEATIEGNDFSDNQFFGLRCFFYPPSLYTTVDVTQPITAFLHVTVRDNRLNRNADHGIDVDAAFASRNYTRQLTGMFEGTFEHNALIDNGRNAGLFTFTHKGASLGYQPRNLWKYMQESTWQVVDLDGELAGFDYDHPLNDPFDDSSVVGNMLIYNGEVQPNGIRITPHP